MFQEIKDIGIMIVALMATKEEMKQMRIESNNEKGLENGERKS